MPSGVVLVVVMISFDAVTAIVTAVMPRGDYAKAIRALRRRA